MGEVWFLHTPFHSCLRVSSCMLQGEKETTSLHLVKVSLYPKHAVPQRLPSELLQTAVYTATLGILLSKQYQLFSEHGHTDTFPEA